MNSFDPNFHITASRAIGRRYGAFAVLIGLGIAYVMYTCMLVVAMDTWSHAAGWIVHVKFSGNIIFGAIATFVMAIIYGSWAGVKIIVQKSRYAWIGIIAGFSTVIIGGFIGSLPGFFQQGVVNYGFGLKAAFDYIVKPVLAITLVGSFTILFLGIWAGRNIHKKI